MSAKLSRAGISAIAGLAVLTWTLALGLASGEEAAGPAVFAESYDITAGILTGGSPLEVLVAVTVRNAAQEKLDSVSFYLHSELKVESVREDEGRSLAFEQKTVDYFLNYSLKANMVTVRLESPMSPGKSTTLRLKYAGRITPSKVRSRSDGDQRIAKDFVLMRGFLYCLWFPVVHPGFEGASVSARFRLDLSLPNDLRPVAFGRLVSEQTEGGVNRSVWESLRPMRLMCASVIAAPWRVVGTDEFRIYVYDPEDPESRRIVDILMNIGAPLRRRFKEHYGADVETAPFFVAELDTLMGATGSGSNTLGLSRNTLLGLLDKKTFYAAVEWLGHEIVHEYVVTPVDQSAPGAAVLMESFPLYLHLPFLSEILGSDFQNYWMRRDWRNYDRGRRGVGDEEGELPGEKPLAAITLEELPQYKDRFLISDKALIAFDHLRRNIGDEAFFNAVGSYLEAHREKPGRLSDFEKALADESGKPMRDFFRRWFETTEQLPMEWRREDIGQKR